MGGGSLLFLVVQICVQVLFMCYVIFPNEVASALCNEKQFYHPEVLLVRATYTLSSQCHQAVHNSYFLLKMDIFWQAVPKSMLDELSARVRVCCDEYCEMKVSS